MAPGAVSQIVQKWGYGKLHQCADTGKKPDLSTREPDRDQVQIDEWIGNATRREGH